MTYQQLLQQTQITELDMKCNLIPLLQLKILTKSNPGNSSASVKEFNQTDVYQLNGSFKHSMYKIRVPIAHAKENKMTEKADVADKVDEDRRHMVEATIVKVMKTRRKIEHNALIAEAAKILSQKFNPDPVMIKKRIESLIDREYMERDTEDRRFYKYIA
jgi:cullin 3